MQQVYHQKGEPVPSGWCRFALRRPPGTPDPDSAADKWHVAFSGARLADIRTVLDHGQLLLPGNLIKENLQRYDGKVKSSQPRLRETLDKRPLGWDLDRSWCHRHTTSMIKLFWSQLMDSWA